MKSTSSMYTTSTILPPSSTSFWHHFICSLRRSSLLYLYSSQRINLRVNLAWLWMTFETQHGVGTELKLHSIDDGEILRWCLDLHEASLLTIGCAHLIKLDSEHHLYVWALIAISSKVGYAHNSLIRLTITINFVSIR